MKIHIVQKGDTLWEIAKKYGVGFEELKAVNTQLSNPEMIMPGMKIKVPTGTVHVKKEAQIGGVKKEAQIIPAPKKEQQIQPLPFIVEEEMLEVEEGPFIPQMPQMPQMPVMPPQMPPQVFVMPQMPAPPPQMPVMPPPQMPQYQPLEIDINNYNLMGMGAPQIPPTPQNVLPGMLAPEEEDFGPEEDYETEMPHMPYAQQMPLFPQMPVQQPAMFNNCMPITPVMPGYGFNYVPGFQGGFPQQGPFNPMGGFPRTEGVKKEVKEHMVPVQMAPAPVQLPPQHPFEIDINNFNIMQTQMPQMVAGMEDEMEEVPYMPQMAPMAPMQAPPLPMGPCLPVSPVMPGSGFNGGFPGMGPGPMPFGPGMPMQVAPQALGPAMSNNPFGNPAPGFAGPMNPQMMPSQFYNKKDCGCGGPKPFGGQFPQQGFPMGQPGFPGQFPQQGFPMGQPGFPGQFQPEFQGGFQRFQDVPFGINPNQMGFNPMFNMPDVDDDLDD